MNEIQEYNGVEAALSEIKSKYAGRVYDVTTKQGLVDARLARREVREVRTGLEKLRKEIKAPALARCQAIDTEAKRITAELLKIEEPIDTLISAEEQRVENEKREKARQEELRVGLIKERIESFNVVPPWGAKAAEIMKKLRDVQYAPIDDSFAEFQDAAAIVKAQAITRLSTMHAEAAALEAEQENLRKAKAENDRLMAEAKARADAALAEERARAEAERQERIAAQKKLDEAAAQERARLAEEARIAREGQLLAEQAAEVERKAAADAAERAAYEAELMAAKCDTAEAALALVSGVCFEWASHEVEAEDAMEKITTICNANTFI